MPALADEHDLLAHCPDVTHVVGKSIIVASPMFLESDGHQIRCAARNRNRGAQPVSRTRECTTAITHVSTPNYLLVDPLATRVSAAHRGGHDSAIAGVSMLKLSDGDAACLAESTLLQ